MAGQYFDAETGLHYNYHRFYDPATGRYMTPDPIGLDGGINLFAYTSNNPTNGIDPNGLELFIIGRGGPYIRPSVPRTIQRINRTIPRDSIRRIPQSEQPKFVPRPAPNPIPKPSGWQKFWKDMADFLDNFFTLDPVYMECGGEEHT